MRDNLVKIDWNTVKCWENARSQSFYARDNVCNFIKWCRFLRVREAVIFESEDLVLHNNPRNVVLCLLEVARIACTRYSFSPAPGLVTLEQDIDAQIEKEGEGDTSLDKVDGTTARCAILGDAADSAAASSEDAGCWSSEGLSSPRRSPSATSLVSSTSMASSGAASSADASTFVADNNSSSALLISQLDQKVSREAEE